MLIPQCPIKTIWVSFGTGRAKLYGTLCIIILFWSTCWIKTLIYHYWMLSKSNYIFLYKNPWVLCTYYSTHFISVTNNARENSGFPSESRSFEKIKTFQKKQNMIFTKIRLILWVFYFFIQPFNFWVGLMLM